jgi:hypothetical protein
MTNLIVTFRNFASALKERICVPPPSGIRKSGPSVREVVNRRHVPDRLFVVCNVSCNSRVCVHNVTSGTDTGSAFHEYHLSVCKYSLA